MRLLLLRLPLLRLPLLRLPLLRVLDEATLALDLALAWMVRSHASVS